MKKIIVIISFLILSNHLYSQKNIYQFDLGVATVDAWYSQVVSIDYSRQMKKQKWRWGFIFQYSNIDWNNVAHNYVDTVHMYVYNKSFTFSYLLKNHEEELGSIKLKCITHYYQSLFLGSYISRVWYKKNHSFSLGLGLGPEKFTLIGEGGGGKAIVGLDTTKKAEFIIPYFASWYSLVAYADFRFVYYFNNRLLVGTKVSIDYDIIDYGGFPMKNTIFIGIKF